MNEHESFSNSVYEEEAQLAEREMSAFIGVVKELFGPEQAQSSAQDWLEESKLMDSPPRSTARDWRAVTVAASARLASRIDARKYRQKSLDSTTNTKVSPIPSFNCSSLYLLL